MRKRKTAAATASNGNKPERAFFQLSHCRPLPPLSFLVIANVPVFFSHRGQHSFFLLVIARKMHRIFRGNPQTAAQSHPRPKGQTVARGAATYLSSQRTNRCPWRCHCRCGAHRCPWRCHCRCRWHLYKLHHDFRHALIIAAVQNPLAHRFGASLLRQPLFGFNQQLGGRIVNIARPELSQDRSADARHL